MSALSPSRTHAAEAILPALFVVLWSTGFIGAKYGLPYIEPFTFLLVRFIVVAALLALIAFAWRAPWPKHWTEIGHIAVAGLLVQGIYLGGVFASIHAGVPAGVSALIVSIQPLLTAAVVGPFLGERVSGRQWFGFALGFLGVALVVARTIDFAHQGGGLAGAGLVGFGFSAAALVGITIGTLYQKKYCAGLDLRTGSCIQFMASALFMALLATLFETRHIVWAPPLIFAFVWLVVVLSLGAISLLYVLIRRGAASRVVSLFYLVPPVTALMAYGAFGERLGPLALLGMALAVLGVALVNR
jgi:drug/metabolite transporter (DMT)-like permease